MIRAVIFKAMGMMRMDWLECVSKSLFGCLKAVGVFLKVCLWLKKLKVFCHVEMTARYCCPTVTSCCVKSKGYARG